MQQDVQAPIDEPQLYVPGLTKDFISEAQFQSISEAASRDEEGKKILEIGTWLAIVPYGDTTLFVGTRGYCEVSTPGVGSVV